MSQLSFKDVESELSYAYLHAVSAAAQVNCRVGNRHEDNAGIDAQLTGWGPFPGGGAGDLEEVDIKIQLKATIKHPALVGDALSYSLQGIKRYDDLRMHTHLIPRILVVLFLPRNTNEWLVQDDDALKLQRCAYWVSLKGADPSANDTAQTVYLPKAQRFDRQGLLSLLGRVARHDVPTYSLPTGAGAL